MYAGVPPNYEYTEQANTRDEEEERAVVVVMVVVARRRGGEGAAGKKKMKTAKKYACDFCGYCTSKKGHLTTHMRTHTGKGLRMRFCDYRARW